ncbi:sensor histidine kinase [Anaerosacchariphilus polymeriproducens]|uniref:histidine kinase n=1 Tax=Anaerosacchariphilus polymeriproducens TaxID=1812858 RepID=A0A371ATF4_9FIRM|nr:histidine kinase [Anaerosacchariphilus polymeriproducens]RDU22832.1 sensor histidine kinase [Anaerosacchariphilus polymeriproducens]
MSVLIDKLILLVGCFILYISNFNDIAGVYYLLGAISLTCFVSYFAYRRESFILILIFLVSSFIFPKFCFYFPLIIYDLYAYRHKILSFAGIIVFINFATDITPLTLTMLLLFSSISVLLQYKSEHLYQLHMDFKKLRDTSTEYNLLLRSKNKDLIEKQDYEIHLATLKERNRIAREIHDNVGHVLSRSLLQLGAIMATNKDKNMSKPLTALKDTLASAMNNIRDSVHDLHEDSIDLCASIQALLDDFKTYHTDFDYDMSENLPRNIKYCLIAITKEALSNLNKHSNASKLTIHLREHPGFYQLLIEDNGSNIKLNSNGIGLENMKDRVDNVNGTFRINTENGFKIFVSIPKTNYGGK